MKIIKSIFSAFSKKDSAADRHRAELEQETLDQLKAMSDYTTLGFVVPLFLLFWIADIVIYPQFKYELGLVRLATTVAMLISNHFAKKQKSLTGAFTLTSVSTQICSLSILALL